MDTRPERALLNWILPANSHTDRARITAAQRPDTRQHPIALRAHSKGSSGIIGDVHTYS